MIAASAICAPECPAAAAAYMTMLMGGSSSDALRAGAIAYGSSDAFKDIDSWRVHTWGDGVATVVSSGVVGGVTSKLQGGSFDQGFESSAIFTTARIAWSKTIETQAGIAGGCGNKCVEARPGLEPLSDATPKPAGVALMDPDANNLSLKVLPNNPITAGSEGGLFSVIMDHIPGMNAVADMHDALNPLDNITGVGAAAWFVGSMPIAAAVSYSALQYGYHFEYHQ